MEPAKEHRNASILIVDDELANVRFLEALLEQAGYSSVHHTTLPREAISRYLELQPDLILLDLHMPQMDGFEVLSQFQRVVDPETYLPILVLTADATPKAKQRALAGGAHDFLVKPLDATEVLLRVKNLLQTRRLHQQLRSQNQHLEAIVYQRTEALEETRHVTLQRLALAAEYRDDETGQHTRRVGHTAALLGSFLDLPETQVASLRRAAPLHDIGKIGIPDSILLKPGKLTADEMALMRAHTTIGARILGNTGIPVLDLAAEIALSHHERWDGSGYPQGLAGEAIPLSGRIVAIVDVFDALTHTRPYKQAWSEADALAEIEGQSGRQFEPRVVRAFRDMLAMGLHFDQSIPDEPPARQLAAGSKPSIPPAGAPGFDPLTDRELAVLQLIAKGRTNREIGELLTISTGTAKVHVEHIIAKLGANDRTQAAMRGVRFGLLDPAVLDTDD